MKFERINDKQIRCTLTREDLIERHIQINELHYGSAKAKHLFQELMRQASFELGFEATDIPLMVEAIPTTEGSLLLCITKVEYPDELDTRFSNFTNADESDYGILHDEDFSSMAEGADNILDIFRKLKDAALPSDSEKESDAKKKTDSSHKKDATFIPLKETAKDVTDGAISVTTDMVKLFTFTDMSDLIRLAHVLDDFYQGENSLYRHEEQKKYYLEIHKSHHTPSEFNKVCNILSEYGSQIRYQPSMVAYYEEHLKTLIPDTALSKLAGLS